MMLALLPGIAFSQAVTENTFKELGVASLSFNNPGVKRASFTFFSQEGGGDLFLTLNLKSSGKAVLKVIVNEFFEELAGTQLNGTTKVFIPREFFKAENQVTLLASLEGEAEITISDSSKIGAYLAPVVHVSQELEKAYLTEGEATRYFIDLKNNGSSKASLLVSEDVSTIKDFVAFLSGGGPKSIELAPGEGKRLEYGVLALKSSIFSFPNPVVSVSESTGYSRVVMEKPYSQQLTIFPATPTLLAKIVVEKTVLERNETTKAGVEVTNNGALELRDVAVFLSSGSNTSIEPSENFIGALRPGEKAVASFTLTASNYGDSSIKCEANHSIGAKTFAQECGTLQVFIEKPDVLNPLSYASLAFVAFAVLSILAIKVYVPKSEKNVEAHALEEKASVWARNKRRQSEPSELGKG